MGSRSGAGLTLDGDAATDTNIVDAGATCGLHTAMVMASGTWRRPPQLDSDAKRRELL